MKISGSALRILWGNSMSKWVPFKFLYDKLSPEDFSHFFEKEADQTKAFLLSFSSNPAYVEAVIDAYNSETFTDLITKYLSRVEGDSVDLDFIRRVEKHIRSIIHNSKTTFSREYRRNMAVRKRPSEGDAMEARKDEHPAS